MVAKLVGGLVSVFALVLGGMTPAQAADPPPVITIAGDIADGSVGTSFYENAKATAALVVASDPTYALTAGDNINGNGSLAEFTDWYGPTWGVFKARTKPVPGNHEYKTSGASGYFGYFFGGVTAGNNYYAYDVGNNWRAYALDSNISISTDSAQYNWLKADLAAHPRMHYIVYDHRPRYTSGGSNASWTGLKPVWTLVQKAGGDLVLSGHNHQYERFAKMNASGTRTSTGMRQFVIGTGGGKWLDNKWVFQPNSEKRLNKDFGVLELTLNPSSYSWKFIASGRRWDGSDKGDPTGSYTDPARTGMVLDSGTAATNNP